MKSTMDRILSEDGDLIYVCLRHERNRERDFEEMNVGLSVIPKS